jgi:alpha-tubulin suppressor-like RCC1 family protein
MPGQFLSPDGDLESAFVSDPAIIDQFAKTGSLWGWGTNTSGQLADGTTTNRSTPVQTVSLSINWKDMSGSGYGGMGIKTDGTLWTWGYNDSGQLGDGTTTNRSSPVQVAGTTWKKVSGGLRQTVGAIKTDGTLWTWGSSTNGELGDGTTVSKSSPVQIAGTTWKDVSSGQYNISGLKTDGTLWIWGHNSYGQLGDNTYTPKSSPIQLSGTTWKQAALSGMQHSVSIKTDGTIWVWGYQRWGNLANTAVFDAFSITPSQIAGNTWKMVTCGMYHTVAIKTDGTLWTWGRNQYGQLGDNNSENDTGKYTPAQTVTSGTNWKMVSAGHSHTVAVKTDGTLWTWGYNSNGILGDNTETNKSSPIQIVGNNWKKVTAGYGSTFGIYFYDAGNLYP